MCEIYADHPGQTKEEEDLPPPGHRCFSFSGANIYSGAQAGKETRGCEV